MTSNVDVVPCAVADLGSRAMVLTIAFVLPVHCSPAQVQYLRETLFATIAQKMRKAGARLVRRNKTFEFHVPREFSSDVPPCVFTTASIPSVLGMALPPVHAGIDPAHPCFMPEPRGLARLFRAPTCPQSLDGFLQPGVPVLHVHVAAYADATLLGCTMTHVAFDAHGARILLAAWAAATRGRLDAVLESPIDLVPLGSKETQARRPKDVVLDKKQPMRGWFALGPAGKARFVAGFLKRIAKDPTLDHVLVRVPKAWLDAEKRKAAAELLARGRGEWVSTNDVLAAWILRSVYAHRRDATPVAFQSPINLRALLPTAFPPSAPFLNNAVGMVATASIPAHTLAAQPVADTALALRAALNDFRAEQNIPMLHAELAEYERHPARMLFPARPGGEWAILSSWLSVKLHELEWNLGPEPDAPSVHPRWVMSYTQDKTPITMRATGAIISADEEAIWARWTSGKSDLAKMRRAGAKKGILFAGFDVDRSAR
ncbi:hypothetical protein AURDEDRAFT_186751 [Auricularia subglabra TFB-10046 SS5]|uniref:Transferase n=1 Tax=Auricularia subglabra (strain TFB-10046 / SS5) TaxID=717982 RepID=J0D2F5_AURST|nr:hypothetical protein AURDEDRAFT_186751 [Auricularia subglabra TFB-10046 SS5]